MSDLVLDYFSVDLRDEEFEALGRELAGDPAAAERFAQAAERDHQRLGLPAAVPPSRPSRKALLLWGLLGLAALGLAWGFRSRETEALAIEKVDMELKPVIQSQSKALPRAVASELEVKALGAHAFAISLDPRPKGRLAAAVHNASGRRIADLGASAGVWAWDCRLDDGSPAPAGRYELRVDGAGHWSQWVEIRRD